MTDTEQPLYKHELPGAAWQVLLWLIEKMDRNNVVTGGWRNYCALELDRNRIWVSECANKLAEQHLIETVPRSRTVKVLVTITKQKGKVKYGKAHLSSL